jgi:hypothetical protein
MSDPQTPQVGSVATVPVTSAWVSKTNWTQVVGASAMFIAMFTGGKYNLTAEQQGAIITVIGLLQGLASYVFHTFYSPGVKAASLTK